jgi:hypothetical protein
MTGSGLLTEAEDAARAGEAADRDDRLGKGGRKAVRASRGRDMAGADAGDAVGVAICADGEVERIGWSPCGCVGRGTLARGRKASRGPTAGGAEGGLGRLLGRTSEASGGLPADVDGPAVVTEGAASLLFAGFVDCGGEALGTIRGGAGTTAGWAADGVGSGVCAHGGRRAGVSV